MPTREQVHSYYSELRSLTEDGDSDRYRAFIRTWSAVIGKNRAKFLLESDDERLGARLRYLALTIPVSSETQNHAARWLSEREFPLEPQPATPRKRSTTETTLNAASDTVRAGGATDEVEQPPVEGDHY